MLSSRCDMAAFGYNSVTWLELGPGYNTWLEWKSATLFSDTIMQTCLLYIPQSYHINVKLKWNVILNMQFSKKNPLNMHFIQPQNCQIHWKQKECKFIHNPKTTAPLFKSRHASECPQWTSKVWLGKRCVLKSWRIQNSSWFSFVWFVCVCVCVCVCEHERKVFVHDELLFFFLFSFQSIEFILMLKAPFRSVAPA